MAWLDFRRSAIPPRYNRRAMAQSTSKRNYKQTLNLPKTAFPMKANLVQNEPASMKRWDEIGVYHRLRRRPHPRGRYVFHDGPPYANGSIHLGHLLNKVLKDLVVRGKTMLGYDVPYVPGWDCHGLPIEHKVVQEGVKGSRGQAAEEAEGATEEKKQAETIKIRRKSRSYAEKFVKLQSQQMRRLLTTADYDEPYLTMNPGYEAAVLGVFGELVEKGLVYRGLKPVHWSIDNQTALADAELEYHEREDTSVYVLFEVEGKGEGGQGAKGPSAGERGAGSDRSNPRPLDPSTPFLMIWTTTPWTLPANLAVAVSPSAEYGLFDLDGKKVWIACDLASKVLASEGVDAPTPETVCRGEDLVGLTYRHPFLDDGNDRRVVAADYVTLEDGTGLVHTAPGHGVEDYQTGLREGLDIYCPVQSDGTFDDSAPDWLQGKSVWDANALVCDELADSGHLFHRERFTHSYPHDWRSKTPVIFRATEQWFIAVDETPSHEAPHANAGPPASPPAPTLRRAALDAIEAIQFLPAWGKNRMRGMLETRPDWCISRQRAWGLPIPAFYPPENEDGDPLLTAASVAAVAKIVEEYGSDAWFGMTADELLMRYDPDADPAVAENPRLAWIKEENRRPQHPIRKGSDIFDVWFESGSSWRACMQARGLACPSHEPAHTDLYLEGSDQHRGWFQLSLLPSLGATGKPPFAAVLTHGFMVGREGKKMSKSGGNALDVDELLKSYGADVCRWWVASTSTENDIKVDEDFFKTAGEQYRKVRNTLRFMLSNLGDFDVEACCSTPLSELDKWVLVELDRLVADVRKAFDDLAFRRASERLFNFCNETLSAVYLFAVKDRLYCDAPDSGRRRSAQWALWRLSDSLCRLLAPILPHTADEAFGVLHGRSESGDAETCVHLVMFPEPEKTEDEPFHAVMRIRDGWLKRIEQYRQSHDIDNPLDLGYVASLRTAGVALDKHDASDLADILGVSRFQTKPDGDDEVVDLRDQPRCERSWKRDATVQAWHADGHEYDGAVLSKRDAEAVGLA